MILDTSALSAAADREPTALKIVAGAENLAVPVIVLGEYRLSIAQAGIERLRRTGLGSGLPR